LTSDLKEPESPALIIDTSALINILGCGDPKRLLECLGRICVVEERVLGELRRHPVPTLDARKEVETLANAGLIRLSRMTDEEYELYLQIAAVSGVPGLGSGESAAIALAATPGACHAIVLDERKARHRVAQRFAQLRVVSSLNVFLEAGHNGKLDQATIRSFFSTALDTASMGILKEERTLVAHLNLDRL